MLKHCITTAVMKMKESHGKIFAALERDEMHSHDKSSQAAVEKRGIKKQELEKKKKVQADKVRANL